MSLVTRQSMTDDTGTFIDGTVVSKAFVDQVYDQIDDQAHSSTNPTQKPKATTDEVIAARGSKASLDARLDVALNEDGTPKSVAGQATETQVFGGLGAVNLIGNPDFQIWPVSDAFAPAYFVLGGAGAAVARIGTGLGDTNRKIGDFAAKVTSAAAIATLKQTLLSTAGMTRSGFAGLSKTLAVGAWVKCGAASAARLVASDGVTTSNGSFHSGSGNWEFLTVSQAVGGSATQLWVELEVAIGQNASLSGLTAMLLPYSATLTQFMPCPVVYQSNQFNWLGNIPAAATDQRRFRNPYPFIVKNVALHAKTAPATTAIIMDVNHWDGAAFNTMFSTRPQIAAAANFGNANPDSTYANRCFYGYRTSGSDINNALLSLDVDQVGTGTVGADVTAEIHHMFYTRALDIFNDIANLGE